MKERTATGFTLIETLVAVTILTLAVAGPMVTANRAIVASQTARDQLTASYLAQEGIEYVRALRDKEFLAAPSNDTSQAWPNFISQIESICKSPLSCTLDPTRTMGYGSGFAVASYGGNAPLYVTSANRYTQQSLGNTRTVFTRTIQVVPLTPTDERITSTVSWTYHSTNYSVSITDHLTPWQ